MLFLVKFKNATKGKPWTKQTTLSLSMSKKTGFLVEPFTYNNIQWIRYLVGFDSKHKVCSCSGNFAQKKRTHVNVNMSINSMSNDESGYTISNLAIFKSNIGQALKPDLSRSFSFSPSLSIQVCTVHTNKNLFIASSLPKKSTLFRVVGLLFYCFNSVHK